MAAAAMRRRGGRPRARRSVADSAAPTVTPTPETARKLRRDLIEHLHAKGRLRAEHVRAAEEIRRIWQAFSRGLGPSAVNPEAFAGGGRSLRLRSPVDWLSDHEEIVWRKRYRPWAAETGAMPSGGVIRISRLQIVVDLVVDNAGLRQVDAWYRMRNGSAFEHLRSALHRYAELAGWVDEP